MAEQDCNWTWIESAADAPTCGGVYAIYLDSVLVYLGSSRSVRTRLRTHRLEPALGEHITPWGTGRMRIKVRKTKRKGDWLMYEFRLINRLRPRGNRDGVYERPSERIARQRLVREARLAARARVKAERETLDRIARTPIGRVKGNKHLQVHATNAFGQSICRAVRAGETWVETQDDVTCRVCIGVMQRNGGG
jgi:hypothetical protein